ncbi:EnvZ/OmpR regulon moderator MzrA [Escherichia coli]
MQIPRMSLRQPSLVRRCFTSGRHAVAGLVRGSPARVSTLAIRAVHQGTTMPDGFSIWHHLDAHGIPFKSITPKNDTLLITFDSSDQSAAAKAVLDRTLPQGYIIAQQDKNSQAMQWLTRLRITHIASG